MLADQADLAAHQAAILRWVNRRLTSAEPIFFGFDDQVDGLAMAVVEGASDWRDLSTTRPPREHWHASARS